MPVTYHFEEDQLQVDGIETIAYKVNPVGNPFNVAGAFRTPLTGRELAGLGQFGLEPTDIKFCLPGQNLGAVVPNAGDVITDAANVGYTIVTVMYVTLVNTYKCYARQRK